MHHGRPPAIDPRYGVIKPTQISVGRQVDIVINVNRVGVGLVISVNVGPGKGGPDNGLGVQGGAGAEIAVKKNQLLPGEIQGPPGKVAGLAVGAIVHPGNIEVMAVVRARDEFQGGQDRVPLGVLGALVEEIIFDDEHVLGAAHQVAVMGSHAGYG